MRGKIAGLALAALLLGCNDMSLPKEAPAGGEGYAVMDADMASREQTAPAPPPPPPPPPMDAPSAGVPAQQQAPGGPMPVAYLAYSYQTGLELPGDKLSGVMQRHIKACQDVGPRLCQLIGSYTQGSPDTHLSASVSLRGEPAWLRGFIGGLDAQADAAGGRILSQSTSTEDLTRAIVDTEATLKAQRSLRDRLQSLLESRPGRLSDLLEVERELARVQAEIDAHASNLAVMRTRVDMSALTLTYESSAQPLRGDTFRPLGEALAGFVGYVVQGLAAIITLIALLLPWALVLGLFGWLALSWRRRNGGRFFRRKAPPQAPPAAQG